MNLFAGRTGFAKAAIGRILFGSLVLLSFFKLHAQEDLNYSVHANIIYRFTKYINWPPNKTSSEFIIGVVGETPLTGELKKVIAGKQVAGQSIVVKKFSSSTPGFKCNILFISDDASSSLKKIINATADDPVLVVSENKGFASRGSCINFNIVNDKLKLEINKNTIQQRGLEIASELLRLGVLVK